MPRPFFFPFITLTTTNSRVHALYVHLLLFRQPQAGGRTACPNKHRPIVMSFYYLATHWVGSNAASADRVSLSLSKRTVLKVTCSADRSEASREKTHRSVWVAWETKRNLRVSRVAPDQTHLLFLHIYLLQLLFWHTELVKIVFHNTIFLFHSTENHRVPFWHFVNWSIHIDCSPPPFLL